MSTPKDSSANAGAAPQVVTNSQRPPSLCMKPMPLASVSSPPNLMSPPISLTTKEWIVPPRPKPGRKPATDTPPTKRKAQNRAAQRAFRERRAARVGELEDQLKQIEDEHDATEDNLRAQVAQLEQHLQQCQADLASWVARCRELEAQLADARAPSLQPVKSSPEHKSAYADGSRAPAMDSEEHSIGCGRCTLDSRCQCIDDVVEAITREGGNMHQDVPTNIKDDDNHSEMEIDFTTAFSGPPRTVTRNNVASPASVVADPCGFCQDGTPCICAEMAADQDARGAEPRVARPTQKRVMSQFTPPPSEGEATSVLAPTSSCASGPGTCAQCRADPNSTLFCKSLAASRQQSGPSSGCCGGKTASGGCCQTAASSIARNTRSRTATGQTIQLPPPPPQNPRSPVTLSCADAYTALSRHAGYEKASNDMGSWMPKLYANPAGMEGRPAMEIDAANVMAVLKDFDRRFGANK